MIAVLADSASLPRSECEDAQRFAAENGIRLRVVVTNESENEAYAVNGAVPLLPLQERIVRCVET